MGLRVAALAYQFLDSTDTTHMQQWFDTIIIYSNQINRLIGENGKKRFPFRSEKV